MQATRADARVQAGSLGTYLREIELYPVLTKDAEARLAQTIAEGQRAGGSLDNRNGRPPERGCRERAVAGKRARNELIVANLRLVASLAKRHRHTRAPLADLIGYGNLGLFHAVDKFDWRRGYRFSTYARWWIRDAIKRGAQASTESIHLPTHVTESIDQVGRTRGYLEAELGRVPTYDELARTLGLSERRVRELEGHRTPPASLSQPIWNSNVLIGDTVVEAGADSALEDMLGATFMSRVTELLDVLDSRERTVISLRYGLAGRRPHTLEETGARIHLSRERARQIEACALSKLRHPSAGADSCKELMVG